MISDLLARLWRSSPAAPAADADGINSGNLPKLPPSDPIARRRAILTDAVEPALAWLAVRAVPADNRARVLLLAITGQEADAQYRRQHGNGPARGLWQFESGGGVRGVLMHRSSARLSAALCEWRGVKAEAPLVHAALERDDVLAAGFARLLLWTDPRPLPDNEGAAWDYYLRNWRPGAYTRGTEAERAKLRAKWGGHWKLAREAVE